MEQNNISEEKDKEEIKAKPNQKKRNRKKSKETPQKQQSKISSKRSAKRMEMHQHPPVQRSEAHQVQLNHNQKQLIYMGSFTINNITYKTSKHFIQSVKAKHYGDSKTEITILICETALETNKSLNPMEFMIGMKWLRRFVHLVLMRNSARIHT